MSSHSSPAVRPIRWICASPNHDIQWKRHVEAPIQRLDRDGHRSDVLQRCPGNLSTVAIERLPQSSSISTAVESLQKFALGPRSRRVRWVAEPRRALLSRWSRQRLVSTRQISSHASANGRSSSQKPKCVGQSEMQWLGCDTNTVHCRAITGRMSKKEYAYRVRGPDRCDTGNVHGSSGLPCSARIATSAGNQDYKSGGVLADLGRVT